MKRKSKEANTTVKSETCQHIEMFNFNLLHKIGTNTRYILHVLKIPFARELLQKKQTHLCRTDPFIIRPTWLL